MRSLTVAVVVAGLLAACSGSSGSNSSGSGAGSSTTGGGSAGSSSTTAPVNPYPGYRSTLHDGTTNWLCHPSLPADECRGDQSVTVIGTDGTRTVRRVSADRTDQPIDCFYVYPTVSTDPGTNSDLKMDAAEKLTVRAQVARYSSVCRVFAPAYRQSTLSAIASGKYGQGAALAYADVLDAWKTYISQDNAGRGVVLIGHSQGTGHLTALIKNEIDRNPVLRKRLVSAILLGGAVAVPKGKAVGGDFANIPACSSATEIGCVISYASFSASQPPTGAAIFGTVRGGSPGQRALCVNPVELAGGNGLADAVLPVRAGLLGTVDAFTDIRTPYVAVPAALRAACRDYGSYTVLAFSPAREGDPRPIDALLKERIGPAWGLHLLDANLAQDDLISMVERQARAYAGRR